MSSAHFKQAVSRPISGRNEQRSGLIRLAALATRGEAVKICRRIAGRNLPRARCVPASAGKAGTAARPTFMSSISIISAHPGEGRGPSRRLVGASSTDPGLDRHDGGHLDLRFLHTLRPFRAVLLHHGRGHDPGPLRAVVQSSSDIHRDRWIRLQHLHPGPTAQGNCQPRFHAGLVRAVRFRLGRLGFGPFGGARRGLGASPGMTIFYSQVPVMA
jgi:hypothetical protein